MDIQAQRKIDRLAGSLICGLLSMLPQKEPGEYFRPKRVLVILLSEMGSLVLAGPMFDKIAADHPDAKIHVLIFEKNREFLNLLGWVPAENVHTVRGDSLVDLARDSLQFIKKARRVGIDTVIDCELFSRISSIYAYLSGATVRVGFERHNMEGLYRGSFINRPALYNPYQHISQQFVTMVEAVSSGTCPRAKGSAPQATRLSAMRFGADEVAGLRSRLERDFPGILAQKLVLISPGGGALPIRAWPQDSYCEVASVLNAEGYHVGIIGMQGDKALASRIMGACDRKGCYDLTGYTRTVRELMVLFNLASLLIANDGGPGHFAALTPLPTILLYGPETPQLYGPLDPKACVFYKAVSCSPCLTAYNHRNSPCDGDNLCLQAIAVEDVLQRAGELLSDKAVGKSV